MNVDLMKVDEVTDSILHAVDQQLGCRQLNRAIRLEVLSRLIDELNYRYVNECGIVHRIWMRHGDIILRFLSVDLNEQLEYGGAPRWFLYRLPYNDPRPWGDLHDSGGTELGNWYASLPFGQWIETQFHYEATNKEAA